MSKKHLPMRKWGYEKLLSLPKGFECYVTLQWRYDAVKRKIRKLRKYGYFKGNVRTEKKLLDEHKSKFGIR